MSGFGQKMLKKIELKKRKNGQKPKKSGQKPSFEK